MTAIPNKPDAEPDKPEGEPAAPTPEEDVKMTIWEHLDELRRRLVRSAIAVLITTCVAWGFKERILGWLIKPYEVAWKERGLPGTPDLQGLSPAHIFMGYLELALTAGVIAGAPIIFYQLWAFVSPGLYRKEKRLIVPFVLFSTSLFLSGIAFAYYIAFPFTFRYFFSLLGPIGNSGAVLTQHSTMEYYLDFTTQMLLAFGVVFELPLFIMFLALAGIVTPKQLLRFGRWAVLLSFVVGAIATPGPEITSQLAVSGALVILYFISVGLAFIVARNKKKREAQTD
ncbi:MAG TPA: twin-arginine translocase subunit TatC [Polyangiaceae bacterium]|jgi:sec-independent protein translocase protein TatC